MASYIETKAVSIRKGDTTSNINFVGVLGEVTADLGYELNGVLGTDIHATLRLHNGITPGGIPMCRADTRNITSQVLAENRNIFGDKNLAYADLSNIEKLTDQTDIDNLVNTFADYGIVNENFLDTTLENYALRDMSNVVTSTLATGRGRGENGNLAYADTSNINTADLADHTIHDGTIEGDLPLAYANASNLDTTYLTQDINTRPNTISGPVLAINDLSNVDPQDIYDILFNPENNFNLQVTTNMDTDLLSIIGANTRYPSSSAVQEYVITTIDNYKFLKATLENLVDEGIAVLQDNGGYEYQYSINNIIDKGYGFNADVYPRYFLVDTTIPTSYNTDIYYQIFVISDTEYVTDKKSCFKFIPEMSYEDLSNTTFDVYQHGSLTNKYTLTIQSTPLVLTESNKQIYTHEIIAVKGNGTFKQNDIHFTDPLKKVTGNPTYIKYIENRPFTENGPLQETSPYLGENMVIDISTGKQDIPTIIPQKGNLYKAPDTEFTVFHPKQPIDAPEEYKNAKITIKCQSSKSLNATQSCMLLKTDFTNLLGMDARTIENNREIPWYIDYDGYIENIVAPLDRNTDTSVRNEWTMLTTKGIVHKAALDIKDYIEQTSSIPNWQANKEYVITPYSSKVLYNGDIYYCLSAHTSGSSFDTSKWRRVFNSTYEYTANKNTDMSIDPTNATKFPTNSAVAKYVKEQIDAVHIPGHYHGQVAIMVPTEASLPPATNPEYPNIQVNEGLTALVENYNSKNKPAIATYTNSAWTYEELILQNGIYVYVLNLGTSYDNGPGTATWNDDTGTFDIAPDKFQVPDGITLNINESTGAIQIVPSLQQKLEYVDVSGSIQDSLDEINDHLAQLDSSLSAMIIPNPQFFTGTNTVGQQLVISDDVAFDLYINGQFQYPNTYTYTASSKTITLNFAVENTVSNGIAVIYRGFRTL